MNVKKDLTKLLDNGLLDSDVCEEFKMRLYKQLQKENTELRIKFSKAVNED